MNKLAKQRADRIAALRAEFGKLDDAALLKAAQDAGAKLEGDETRDELEFATAEATVVEEEQAAADAERQRKDDEARAEREAFYKTPAGRKQRAQDEKDASERAIRRVHSSFIKALPSEARSTGACVVNPDAPEAGSHPVADGNYRVAGSDWVMSFKDKKWSGAYRAHALSDPDWTEIPDAPGGAVGAPAPKSTAE
jgi:hypothetical protein